MHLHSRFASSARVFSLILAAVTGFGLASTAAHAEARLVVEAETGRVLHAENAAYPWYPASVTKLMTAYVTLKAVKAGRIRADTLFTVSPNALAQQPSKMGFPVGTQVTVDNALKMVMVKSANDMAVVLAEGVSGSVEQFAAEMNAASARLGMTQSHWVNPNGLPDEGQVTSARDMAILARTLIRELPEYELYWRISAIKFGRRVMRNYNKLIDRYPGADGMKTGFICASGYNLVASATRNGKRLITVVLGSPSGKQRAETAAGLLEKGFSGGTGLAWLMPSLGTVDALQPVAATPLNLREEICGKGRRVRTDHAEEEEQPAGAQVDQASAAYASVLPSFRTPGDKTSLLANWTPQPPIPVSVIPVKGIKAQPDGAPEEKPALVKKKKGRATAVIAVPRTAVPAAIMTEETAAKATEAGAPAAAKKPRATRTAAKPKPAPQASSAAMSKPAVKEAAKDAAQQVAKKKPKAPAAPKPQP